MKTLKAWSDRQMDLLRRENGQNMKNFRAPAVDRQWRQMQKF